MIDGLLQKGITITRFIVSSSQISVHMNFAHLQGGQLEWTDYVQQIIQQSSNHPGVANISLIDEKGTIIANSEPEKIGRHLDGLTLDFLKELSRDKVFSIHSKYRFIPSTKQKRAIFQIASPFPDIEMSGFVYRKVPGQTSRPIDEKITQTAEAIYQRWYELAQQINSKEITVLIDLDLDQFNAAMSHQQFQILSLSIVLLLVGIGGWLSLLTLQGLKGSQTRLQNIRAFNDMLISSLPVGMIATDNRGAIRICNNVAEDILNVHENQIVGSSPSFALPREIALVLSEENSDQQEPLNKKIVFEDHVNRLRTLRLTGLSVVDSGKHYVGNMLLIQDISQVVELEDELHRSERLAALGKMAAGVAHELRNPLSSIKGLAVLLQTKFIKTGKGQDIVNILVGEVERLNRSIGELMEYAHPENLRKGIVDLNSIIQKATSLIFFDAEQAGILIETYLDNGSLYVEADPDKLNQVFLNLFINSIQAMEDGGMLKIYTLRYDKFVICRVVDTGCGMDLESQSKVFDPYFTTKPKGTGLGLAMTAKILYEHHGTVELQSREGKGTVVTVRLPSIDVFSAEDNPEVMEN